MVDRLGARYSVDETLHVLAAELGVERSLLAELLGERGIAARYRLADDADVAEAAALYATGLSLAKVGERFGVSAWSVLRAFRSSGVAVRTPRRRY